LVKFCYSSGRIEKVKNKRSRIIKRRKKKGKKKMPRKTLFKPVKQLEVGKDPLWREIFIEQKEEGSSESDSDGETGKCTIMPVQLKV